MNRYGVIPQWHDIEKKADAGEELDPLEQFILDNEPVPPEEFRSGLQLLINWLWAEQNLSKGATTMKLSIINAINSAIDILLTTTGTKEAAISLMGDDVPLYCRDCGEPVNLDGSHIEENGK